MRPQLVFETALPPTVVERREIVESFEERTDGVRFSHVGLHNVVSFAGEGAVEAVEVKTRQTE